MFVLTRRLAMGALASLPCVVSFSSSAIAVPVNEKITGVVPPLRQLKPNGCWATAATMMHSWKKNVSVSVEVALGEIGANYLAIYNRDTGLSGADKPGFILAARLKAEAPQNYTAQGWGTLIRQHGPLWVTTAEGFSIHARVLTAIFGDGTSAGTSLVIIDPADGQTYTEKLLDFDRKFEEVARRDLRRGADIRPQVVHY